MCLFSVYIESLLPLEGYQIGTVREGLVNVSSEKNKPEPYDCVWLERPGRETAPYGILVEIQVQD